MLHGTGLCGVVDASARLESDFRLTTGLNGRCLGLIRRVNGDFRAACCEGGDNFVTSDRFSIRGQKENGLKAVVVTAVAVKRHDVGVKAICACHLEVGILGERSGRDGEHI